MTVPSWLEERRTEQFGALKDGRVCSRPADDYSESLLTRDHAFNRHSINDGEHVSPFDNNTVQVGADGIEVVLVQGIDEEAFRRTLSAATRATIGIDIEPKWEPCELRPADCYRWATTQHRPSAHGHEHLIDPLSDNRDWEEMLKGGLQTALESQVIVFAVKGVSRTATHQIVRSRRAAFHQQSQRASYMGDQPEFRMPESVWLNSVAREAFLKALVTCHWAYRVACEADVSYQDARFILPEGTTNFIMMEYSVREFLNVYAYRACSMFQWEIVAIMRKCRELLVAAYPWLAPYVKISCQDRVCGECKGLGKLMPDDDYAQSVPCSACAGTGLTGSKCTFQGWEDVEGQCSFPWAKHENRIFKPAHHRISRGPVQS